MGALQLYTNNSQAAEFFDQDEFPIEVKWIGTTTMDVLTAAKSAVRQGGLLLSNPLSGIRIVPPQIFPPSSRSAPKPFAAKNSSEPKISSINPYLSLLVTEPLNTVDFASVKRVDEALTLYKKNARLRFLAHSEEAIKNFQTLDLQIMIATLSAK